MMNEEKVISGSARVFCAVLAAIMVIGTMMLAVSCQNDPPAETTDNVTTDAPVTDEPVDIYTPLQKDTVFVTEEGSGTHDGSSPENSTTLAEGLGLTKRVGGTVVVCGPIKLDREYFFPDNDKTVTITSVYGGTDYRDSGAKLILTSVTSFYGDYTLDGIRIDSYANDLLLCCQYNNITFGEDVVCKKGPGVTTDIAIICGYNAHSAAHRSTHEVSCVKDACVTVKSGSWKYIRGGNRRINTSSAFGTIGEGITFVIKVEGGKFTATDGTDFCSATGMNSVAGNVYMEISGGEFRGPVFAASRTGNNANKYDVSITGSVTLKITGGTFKNTSIAAAQSTYDKPTITSSASVTLCIAGGDFAAGTSATGASTNNYKLVLSDSYASTIAVKMFKNVEKGNSYCEAIYAPELKDNAVLYTEPPFPATPPVTGEITPEEEKLLIPESKTKLESYRKLTEVTGPDKYERLRELRDKEDKYNLKAVESVTLCNLLTGEYSPNKTITNYNIAGAGGGYMIDCGDFVLLAFGDNNPEGELGKPWRANSLGFTTDFDYTDGITFDGFYLNDIGEYDGMASDFLLSGHKSGVEDSKIPTGGIKIGDKLYFGYMSVREWTNEEADGIWPCNYGGLAISTDMGRSWQTPSDLRWPEESNYAQLYPVIDGDYVYIFGVPGGRKGACKIMRVRIEEIENFSAYEYMVGRDENGIGIFEKGYDAMMSDFAAIEESVGGVGVMYNEYLEDWIVTYCTPNAGNIRTGSIVMRVAKSLDSVWSDPVLIMSQATYGSVYEPRICARYVRDGGQKMMLICSRWSIYNSLVFEIELSRD
ncbi:MAG: DUF4185 domain-containing protein [Clostridia bacterium]|nr:DUF4185 domain-containing protein [Clostridia bacterium]